MHPPRSPDCILRTMGVTATETTLVEAGLRAEIRLLGQLLGETLREHEGLTLYELEESIRLRTKALRQQYDSAKETELVAELGRIPLADTARLVRAFATYFQLVNLAELERQARSVIETGDETGELDRSVARCAEDGVPAARVAAILEQLEVRPVLTAHPTEAVRRSILDHQDRSDQDGNPNANAAMLTQTLRLQRRTLLTLYRERVRALARDLSQSTRLTSVSQQLTDSIQRDEIDLDDYAATLNPGTREEPYRRKLSFIWRRLTAALDDERGAYRSADELAADLDLIDASLREHGDRAIADVDLLRLRRQGRGFGFIGAR